MRSGTNLILIALCVATLVWLRPWAPRGMLSGNWVWVESSSLDEFQQAREIPLPLPPFVRGCRVWTGTTGETVISRDLLFGLRGEDLPEYMDVLRATAAQQGWEVIEQKQLLFASNWLLQGEHMDGNLSVTIYSRTAEVVARWHKKQ